MRNNAKAIPSSAKKFKVGPLVKALKTPLEAATIPTRIYESKIGWRNLLNITANIVVKAKIIDMSTKILVINISLP